MIINFFITSLGGGGAERVVCNLANYLKKNQNTVTITVLRGKERAYSLDEGISVDFLQPEYYINKEKLYRLKEILSIIKFLRNLPKNSLLVSFLELPVAYSLVFRSLYKQKLVICERNNPDFYSKGYRKLFSLMARKADGCVCQTTTILNWYRTKLSPKTKSIVVANSINGDVLNAAVSELGDKVIMTMGRLEPQKNQAMLISAFAELANVYPEYNLVIYGKGPLENDLKAQITSLGLDNRIELRGFTNNVVEAYRHSCLFVLTSDHEGMPNVLAEAMAMGLPCISTDCGGGGAKELISNGENGLLIPRQDKQSLIKAINDILSSETLSRQLSVNAIKVREKLSPTIIHAKWEDYFKTVIEN